MTTITTELIDKDTKRRSAGAADHDGVAPGVAGCWLPGDGLTMEHFARLEDINQLTLAKWFTGGASVKAKPSR